MNLFWFNIIIIFKISQSLNISYNIVEIYKRPADVNLVLFEDCDDEINLELRTTRINSAIWIVDRLNVLQKVTPLTLGLEIYDVCNEDQYYDTIYQLFQNQRTNVTLGIIAAKPLPANIQEYSTLLNIEHINVRRNYSSIIQATIEILSALNWKNNVTIIVEENNIVDEVISLTRNSWICITQVIVIRDMEQLELPPNMTYVLMANANTLKTAISKSAALKQAKRVILVAICGSKIKNIPKGFYLIESYNEKALLDFTKMPKIVPTPIFFDIAGPFVSFAESLAFFLREHCNNTVDLKICVRYKYFRESDYQTFDHHHLLNFLQIDPLEAKFNYEVFQNISRSLVKLASYNIFQEEFVEYSQNYFDKHNDSEEKDCARDDDCMMQCVNFWLPKTPYFPVINLRSEAWVFGFVAVSSLGVMFCIAIFTFIMSRMYKKQMLDGNPILTLLLLIVVTIMYLSIIPFSIDGENIETKSTITLARYFCVTLPYSATFSLILSRVILLATVSKEAGFMSHISGFLQTFLTIFIFGVQCALSLQITHKCGEIFDDAFLLYLLPYNVVLLALLLLLSPLIAKSQRNYKEGRYFVIATVLISINWCCWIPGYVILNENWKDPLLCAGLVVTASIFVGTIFIPRTYLIAVSAARDKFSNALPSLANVANNMDVYRTSTQPLYDCVNVAAINAHTRISPNNNGNHKDQDDTSSILSEDRSSNASSEKPDKLTRF